MADAPVASLPAAPSMAGVAQNTNDNTSQALAAMARYGQAGLDAYNQAQQAVQAQRQQVLDGLAKTQGLGGDAQSLLASQVQASMAPHLADLSQGQANLAGDLALGQQQYQRYGAEANAAIPVIQAQSQQQMGIRQQALQAAQQQIDAAAAAKAAQDAQDMQIKQAELATQQEQTKQAALSAAAAAAKATPGANMTLDQLLGAASLAQGQNVSPAVNPKAAGPLPPGQQFARNLPDQGLTSEAAQIGQQLGLPAEVIAGLYSPAEQAAISGAIVRQGSNAAKLAPPPPDVSWLTKNVPGVNQQMAQQYVAAPEWQQYQAFTDAFLNGGFVLDNSGKITNANNAPAAYVGKTPRQALEVYVQSLPGYAHMKSAAIQYYGGTLDQISKK